MTLMVTVKNTAQPVHPTHTHTQTHRHTAAANPGLRSREDRCLLSFYELEAQPSHPFS